MAQMRYTFNGTRGITQVEGSAHKSRNEYMQEEQLY